MADNNINNFNGYNNYQQYPPQQTYQQPAGRPVPNQQPRTNAQPVNPQYPPQQQRPNVQANPTPQSVNQQPYQQPRANGQSVQNPQVFNQQPASPDKKKDKPAKEKKKLDISFTPVTIAIIAGALIIGLLLGFLLFHNSKKAAPASAGYASSSSSSYSDPGYNDGVERTLATVQGISFAYPAEWGIRENGNTIYYYPFEENSSGMVMLTVADSLSLDFSAITDDQKYEYLDSTIYSIDPSCSNVEHTEISGFPASTADVVLNISGTDYPGKICCIATNDKSFVFCAVEKGSYSEEFSKEFDRLLSSIMFD